MYNPRESVGSRARFNNFFKTSLGNNTTRYNSEVGVQRKKYLMSSTYLWYHLEKIVKMFPIGWEGRNLFIPVIIIKIGLFSRMLLHLLSMSNKHMSMRDCHVLLILKASSIALSKAGSETNGSWKTKLSISNGQRIRNKQ